MSCAVARPDEQNQQYAREFLQNAARRSRKLEAETFSSICHEQLCIWVTV